jgi:hypothetical protein
MRTLWVWIPAAVAVVALAESLYSRLREHAWAIAFPFILLAAFAFGLAVGAFFLLDPRERV